MNELVLRLDSGDEKGRIFKVTLMGMRLGRSSSNDIHIKDEELSRNHCLFELTGSGCLRVTDLASANGTFVNGEPIGANTKDLAVGDVIGVGNTLLTVIDLSKPPVVEADKIDLGLAPKAEMDEAGKEEDATSKRPKWLNCLWAGVIALMGASIIGIVCMPQETEKPKIESLASEQSVETAKRLNELKYEKIDADSGRIFRYYIEIDQAGNIKLMLDDVPAANRHVRKTAKIGEKALNRLMENLKGIETLEKAYTGESAEQINELKSSRLVVNIAGTISEVLVENAPEPDEFREICEKLETFVNNELGIWSLQYPKEKLLELSFAAFELAESKFDERDVEFGNLAAAIGSYNEAIFYLDTINPKPEWFNKVRTKLKEAKEELEKRHKEQLFKADRAINTGHWSEAETELKLLMEMIPDKEDSRHQTAERKLLDVTKRLKGAR